MGIKANSVPLKLWLDASVKSLFTVHAQTYIQIHRGGTSSELEPVDWCQVPKSEGIFFVRKNVSRFFVKEYGTDWRTPKCDRSMKAIARMISCNVYKDTYFDAFVAWGSFCLCAGYIFVWQVICAVWEAKRETVEKKS